MRHFSCERISHTFTGERGAVHALSNIDLSVAQCEIVCVVGPSGCGKSTLLRILAGLEQPTSGSVHFDASADQRRTRGGLVVQEHGTFPWLTVIDNVAFGLELEGVDRSTRRNRAMDFLTRVGLATFADHYPHELSVGMRQRLGIGRAIVMDSPVLLMDEPFGALDAQTRRRMQHELLTIWNADRRTVVFVTHDIEEAVLLGDRVIVMSGRPGRILADLPVSFARPRDAQREQPDFRRLVDEIWTMLDAPVPAGAR